jgi:hypothetical protein
VRTSIEIDDKLFRKAKIAAASRGTSLKRLMERGLKLALETDKKPKQTRVKLPLFPSKRTRPLKVKDDVAYRAQLAEDLERHAASSRR